MTTGTEHAQTELDDLRRALRSPQIGLLATRAAYRRMGELYRILDLDHGKDSDHGSKNDVGLA